MTNVVWSFFGDSLRVSATRAMGFSPNGSPPPVRATFFKTKLHQPTCLQHEQAHFIPGGTSLRRTTTQTFLFSFFSG